MGKLDEFFKSLGGEKKRPELEILEEIEAYLHEGGIDEAIARLPEIKKEHNLFLALRMIVRAIVETLDEAERRGALTDNEIGGIKERVRSLIPAVNGLFTKRYRAILLSDLAVLFYRLDDELNGDLALKTAINLAGDDADIVRDIIMGLVKRGLLAKAGYAIKMAKNQETIDVVLVNLAESFYLAGDEKRAALIVKHISNPFQRAMALYYMASVEGERDREKALRLLEAAFEEAEKVESSDARFELMLKLYDLKHSLLGESFNVRDVLSWKGVPQE
ncbi:hypothetical protein [Thermococcus camini]|uniref:Uncharacterized protein n=1 Tax=Thermococcus camini TaxID=2016373 RepID=A0A7G2D5Y3_9EURY|nr:hypothetical protein [Thermococcus camini]CAD5243883.1 conserved protein of unknown function [Thermococcus camini]